MTTSPVNLASMIDHTLLAPGATASDIKRLCDEAIQYGFASVCVNSMWVPLCVERLAGGNSVVCTVVGFPLGAMHTQGKAQETELARRLGAREFDMVVPVGALKAGDDAYVQADIAAVVAAADSLTVKVILETSLLSDDEKRRACALATAAGAHFVKTSTGFGGGGATVADLTLMRAASGAQIKLKASGGIRTLADAQAMVAAGANRLGTSQSVAIMTGAAASGGY